MLSRNFQAGIHYWRTAHKQRSVRWRPKRNGRDIRDLRFQDSGARKSAFIRCFPTSFCDSGSPSINIIFWPIKLWNAYTSRGERCRTTFKLLLLRGYGFICRNRVYGENNSRSNFCQCWTDLNISSRLFDMKYYLFICVLFYFYRYRIEKF